MSRSRDDVNPLAVDLHVPPTVVLAVEVVRGDAGHGHEHPAAVVVGIVVYLLVLDAHCNPTMQLQAQGVTAQVEMESKRWKQIMIS